MENQDTAAGCGVRVTAESVPLAFDDAETAKLQACSGMLWATHDVLAEFIYDLLRDFMPAGAVFRTVVDALWEVSRDGPSPCDCAVSAFLDKVQGAVSPNTWTCLTRTPYHSPSAEVRYHNGWIGQMAMYCAQRLREEAFEVMLDPTVLPWDQITTHIKSILVHVTELYDATGAVIGRSTLLPDGSSVQEMYHESKLPVPK